MRADWTDRSLVVGLPFHPAWIQKEEKKNNSLDLEENSLDTFHYTLYFKAWK